MSGFEEVWRQVRFGVAFEPASIIERIEMAKVTEYETCPTCNGSGLKKDPDGNYEIDDPCDDCWGEGEVEVEN